MDINTRMLPKPMWGEVLLMDYSLIPNNHQNEFRVRPHPPLCQKKSRNEIITVIVYFALISRKKQYIALKRRRIVFKRVSSEDVRMYCICFKRRKSN